MHTSKEQRDEKAANWDAKRLSTDTFRGFDTLDIPPDAVSSMLIIILYIITPIITMLTVNFLAFSLPRGG